MRKRKKSQIEKIDWYFDGAKHLISYDNGSERLVSNKTITKLSLGNLIRRSK